MLGPLGPWALLGLEWLTLGVAPSGPWALALGLPGFALSLCGLALLALVWFGLVLPCLAALVSGCMSHIAWPCLSGLPLASWVGVACLVFGLADLGCWALWGALGLVLGLYVFAWPWLAPSLTLALFGSALLACLVRMVWPLLAWHCLCVLLCLACSCRVALGLLGWCGLAWFLAWLTLAVGPS